MYDITGPEALTHYEMASLPDDVQRESLCRQWVRFALTLSREDIQNESLEPYWLPVLRRTRQTLDEIIASDEAYQIAKIKNFVAASVRTHTWNKVQHILLDCQQEFDIDLDLNQATANAGSTVALTYHIRSVLARQPVPVKAEFAVWDTLDDSQETTPDNLETVRTMLRELVRQERGRPDRTKGLELMFELITQPAGRIPNGSPAHTLCIVSKVDGEGTGMLIAERARGVDKLEALFVRPAWRGHGLTRALIQRWQSEALHLVTLEVNSAKFDDNQAAILQSVSFKAVDDPSDPLSFKLQWSTNDA